MTMFRACTLIATITVAMTMAGCNSVPKKDPEFAPVQAPVVPPQPIGNGAIYQAGHEIRWFEDIRARRIGDILTVNLVEETDASISNSTAVKKSNSTSITNPTVLGNPLAFNLPGSKSATTNLGFDLNSSNTFSGEGDTDQSNELSGQISVMVTEVLPNGYLRVRGEKRIGMNGGNEYIKLSGIVRPSDIDTSNSIDSTRVADATLIYVGDGPIADANIMGWMAKFFISAISPF
jgi:flagellar L-ring protein precursor FlgH